MTHLGCPQPGVSHPPVTHGVYDRASGPVESMAHGCVAVNDPVAGRRPAVVILQKVDAPVCKGFSVLLLMTPAACIYAKGLRNCLYSAWLFEPCPSCPLPALLPWAKNL